MSAYSSAVLADSPLVYYRFNDASGLVAFDSSNSDANPGTYTATGVLYTQPGAIHGDPDHSVHLDGSTGIITAPAGVAPSGTAARSAELWFKADSVAALQVIFNWGGVGGTGTEFGAYITAGTLFFYGHGNDFQIGGTITAGLWYHLVITYDGTTTIGYLNGAPTSGTPTLNTTASGITIGALSSGTDQYAGYVDEFATYNHVLTQARVTAHYNIGQNGLRLGGGFNSWWAIGGDE